MREEVIVA